MKITRLSYEDSNWQVKGLELEDINLIVGKNSVGKSRSIMTIDLLVRLLTQKRNMNWGAKWELQFESQSGSKIEYSFTSNVRDGGRVSHEEIIKDGKSLLHRNSRTGSIQLYNYESRGVETAYPPQNKLSVHALRDRIRYPYIEEIAEWAENSFGFKFGNITADNAAYPQEYGILASINDIPYLFHDLSPSSKAKVVQTFNAIGYSIVDIQFHESSTSYLSVKELGLDKRHPHYRLSQGMFRSLALIIYLEYLETHKRVSTLIIDDLCEGLDYERATKLGKLVFERCKASGMQLVATSNDSFLMDVIDLEHWNLLKRDGKSVTALNERNAPGLFARFKFTGLSNFDFFASDFAKQQQPI